MNAPAAPVTGDPLTERNEGTVRVIALELNVGDKDNCPVVTTKSVSTLEIVCGTHERTVPLDERNVFAAPIVVSPVPPFVVGNAAAPRPITKSPSPADAGEPVTERNGGTVRVIALRKSTPIAVVFVKTSPSTAVTLEISPSTGSYTARDKAVIAPWAAEKSLLNAVEKDNCPPITFRSSSSTLVIKLVNVC